jgi:hypothetical protein
MAMKKRVEFVGRNDWKQGEGDEQDQSGGKVDADQDGAPKQVRHYGVRGEPGAIGEVRAQKVAVLVRIGVLDEAARTVEDGFEIRHPHGGVKRYE